MKQLAILSLVLAIFAQPIVTAWTFPTSNCSFTELTTETHYGDCIMKVAYGTAPTNFRDLDLTPVTTSESCVAYSKKYLMVNGLLLLGSFNNGSDTAQTNTDSQMQWTAQAIQEMLEYDASSTCDGYNQCLVMQKMYEFRAVAKMINPQITADETVNANWSSCDIIMFDQASGQVIEVVEHLLHFISDVGLSPALPNIFGFTGSSIKNAMDEAISNGLYVTTDYASLTPDEAKNRVLVQEYFYQLFCTCSGFFGTYGVPNTTEWTLSTVTCDGLKDKNPKGYYLYMNVIVKIIKLPNTATLTALATFTSGQTPEAAPTLTAGSVSNTICTCNCSGGCCSNTPTGDAATYGTAPTGLTDATNFNCAISYLLSINMILLPIMIYNMF